MRTIDALNDVWRSRGIDPGAIRAGSDGTVVATDRTQIAESNTLLVEDSSELGAVALSPEKLELKGLLGRGGMGDVHLATQRSLSRSVAVKTVRAALKSDPTSRSALLKEAWIGGALSHPNVVPVHTIARVENSPALVMKRIEGRSWTELMADPSTHSRFRSNESANFDPLEPHLRTFVSVCRAIEFAHERGILHLDLKPDNVMIGDFGETYVLDWGLSASFGDLGPEWLMSATTIKDIAGTPAYMPPELASGAGDRIGPRTDVYLLGGILHSVLTEGEPLHRAPNLLMTLLRAWQSAPAEYESHVPAELARVVHRATEAEPENRFDTVLALREAVEAYLRHRRAERMTRRAEDTLLVLTERIEAGAGDVEIEPRFAECELAVEHARRDWAEHPRLAELGEALLARRVEHALRARHLDAARAFLAEMSAPKDTLRERVARLGAEIDERTQQVRRLEAMSRELDLSLGTAARRAVFGVLGALWFGISLVFGQLTRSDVNPIGYRELLIEGAILVGVLLPYAWWQRRRLFTNLANRRLYGGLILTATLVELHWVTCLLLEIPALVAVTLTPLYYVYAFGTLAIVLDRRFWIATLAMIVTSVGVAIAPVYVYEVIGVGGGLAVAGLLIVWQLSSGKERDE